jgi:signal peptidase I
MKEKDQDVQLTRSEKLKKEAKSIFWILLLVLTFRSTFFEPFRIPSGSMIPTLMVGDFILVNKFAYGFKIPFTDINLFGFDSNPKYLFGKSDPKRGDVVVFKYPKDRSTNYIKRVIGLPGDTIQIRNKIVYINGEAIATTELDGKKFFDDMDEKYKLYNLKFFEVKNGEAKHTIQFDSDNYFKVDYDERVVPKGHFFVMGDNRDFSYDSRFWGFVPREVIKGEAMFVWFSMIIPFGEHAFKFRPWRIGTVIR